MVCYHPLTAYQLRQSKPNGKKAIVFGAPPAQPFDVVNLPCGQCIGCRLERSRQWAVRCMHEASLHPCNSFLTLTYDDEHIRWSPVTGEQTLYKRDLQLFMKRLRKHLEPLKVRFFACGEYGDNTYRPHYHLILFGFDFRSDRRLYKMSNAGFPYYISDTLNKLWSFGYCLVADVSFDSCAYVARYVTKKLNGEAGRIKYEGIQPEFVNMSRRPGIGADWFAKYAGDVYPYDRVIIVDNDKVRKLRPPKYYDKLYDAINHDEMELIKEKRVENAKLRESEIYTPGRLEAKEKFKLAQIKSLERGKTDEVIQCLR